jgi:HK97 family phage major capsid protein
MKTVQELKDAIATGQAECQALLDVAKEEERENTADEMAVIHNFYGEGDQDGELAVLERQLETARKIEAKKAQYAQQQMGHRLGQETETDKVTVPAVAKRHGHLRAFSTPEDAYKSGQFIRAAIGNIESAAEWCRNKGVEIKNIMTEGVNTAGGFLVPEEFEASLVRLVEEYGVFRSKALNYPMSSDTTHIPKRTGGLTVYFPAEAGSITASDASVGRVSLVARKMATLTRISSELAEDSIVSIADLLAQEIALAFATSEDEMGFNGDGTAATYGGVVGINSAMGAGAKYTAATGNTAFSTIDDADFLGMMGKINNYAGIMPEWYISPEGFYASMARLITASGGVNVADMEGDLRPRFHGRPVNLVNVMNKTLTAQTSTDGLCYYGDLRMAATLGVRRGVTIASDSSVYFATDEIAIRATQRVDINVHDAGTASASGAIVGLTTPGS